MASANIINGTIVNADISATNSITADRLATNSVNSAEIVDGAVRTQEIANNTITETDISDAFVARDSNLLDGIDSTAFVRDTGNETIAGIKTFSSPVVVTDTFNINGSGPSAQQNGLYVADLGATS